MITDSYAPLNTNIPSLGWWVVELNIGWWVVELNIRNTLSFLVFNYSTKFGDSHFCQYSTIVFIVLFSPAKLEGLTKKP